MRQTHSRTFRLTGVYALGSVAQRGVHVVLLPIYTHFLPVEEWGVLALMNVTALFLGTLIATPVSTGALQRYYYHPAYTEKRRLLLANLMAFLLAKTLVVVGIYLCCAHLLARLLLGDPQRLPIVRLYGLVLLLWPVWAMLVCFVRLIEKARYYVVVALIGTLLTAGVVVVGLAWLKLGIYAAVYGQLLSLAVTSLLLLPVFLKHAELKLAPSVIREPLGFGYPLTPSGLARLLVQLGDRYVLRILKSVGQVGAYAFGYGIAEVIDSLLVNPALSGFSPTIRKLESDPPALRQFVRRSATLFYVVAVFVGLGLAAFSREVVVLLGRRPEYHQAWVIVPIVTLAFVQHGLGVFLDWGMTMKNKAYHISGVLLFSAAVNVALNFALIPRWGIIGAATATLISAVLWNALKAYYSAKFYDLRFDLLRLGHITLLGVGLCAASLAAAAAGGLWIGLAAKALAVAAFPVLVYATGVLTEADKRWIRRFLGRVRSEGLLAAARSLREETLDGD